LFYPITFIIESISGYRLHHTDSQIKAVYSTANKVYHSTWGN